MDKGSLLQKESVTQILFNAMPDKMVVVGDGGVILAANSPAARDFGRPAEEIVGQHLSVFLPGHWKENRGEELADAIRRETPLCFEECRENRWYAVRFVPRAVDDDSTVHGVLSVRDITEQKASEASVRLSEEKYRKLAEAAGDIIMTVNLDGIILYANEAAKTFLGGLNPEGMPMKNLLIPEMIGRHEAMIVDRRQGLAEVLVYEWRAKNPMTGSEFIFEVSSSLLSDEGKPAGVLFIARNITKRKQLEAERERLIGELREALAKIKTLHGMLPICAACKKIRNDEGYWEQLEVYIQSHSGAEFSHGLCPECAKKLYPEFIPQGTFPAKPLQP